MRPFASIPQYYYRLYQSRKGFFADLIALNHAVAVGLAKMIDGQAQQRDIAAVIQRNGLHEAVHQQRNAVSLQRGSIVPGKAQPHGEGKIGPKHRALGILAILSIDGPSMVRRASGLVRTYVPGGRMTVEPGCSQAASSAA